MVPSLSHDSMEMSQQDALAGVQVARLESGLPASRVVFSRPWLFPVNTGISPIKLISRMVNAPEIADAVVRPVAIYVVNLIRLLAVMQKPANAMRKVIDALIANAQVATRLKASSRITSLNTAPVGPYLPSQVTS